MFRDMQTPAQKSRKRTRKPRHTVEVVHGLRIRQRGPGKFYLQVRRFRDGLALHETFDSLDAARLRCEQLHRERVAEGLRAYEMHAKDREEAKAAMKSLGGRVTLAEAVKFWLDHHPDGATVSVSDLAAQWLADLARRNCRPLTIAGARRRMARLEKDYGGRPACTLTTAEVVEWLDVNGGGLVNRDNYRRTFRACFAFAKKRGIVMMNPIDGIEPSKRDARIPEHWTPAKVQGVLRAAEEFAPALVPVLTVMAFAGLRPDEAAALRWEHVNLADGVLRVMPSTSKTRRARAVDIPANLKAWLAGHRRARGAVAPAAITFRRWRTRCAAIAVLGAEAVRERLAKQEGRRGIDIAVEGNNWRTILRDARAQGDIWPVDVLRHSYATHWLAQHNDLAKLAVLMGNSQDVILRHYRGLATAAEAAAYWAIEPKEAGNVIRLQA